MFPAANSNVSISSWSTDARAVANSDGVARIWSAVIGDLSNLFANPDITVEVIVDYGLADVVADRFDAGVRLGEQVAKDMIALRISPDIPMAIVGAADYLRRHPAPQEPQQLVDHRCINLRLPTSGTLNAWRLTQDGREMRVRVEGPLVFNTLDLILDSALDGLGLAYMPLDQVAHDIEAGRLVQVLSEWTPPLPGYHLYYPSRRHSSPAFRLFVEALRYRPRQAGKGA